MAPLLAVVLSVAPPAGGDAGGGPAPADPAAVRVMSFNVRYSTVRDGENAWPLRKDFVGETVRAFAPDLLGTQETLPAQRDDLLERLPGYAAVAAGRDDGREGGETAAVFYRTDRFTLLASGHFWLSETPDRPGSRGWDAAFPRVCTWVKLHDRRAAGGANGDGGAGGDGGDGEDGDGGGEDGDRPHPMVWLFNVHFDHRGAAARAASAALLRRQVAALAGDAPAVITGDFNAPPGSEPLRALLDPGPPPALTDTYRAAHDAEPAAGTFTGFRADASAGKRIDYVFATPHWAVVSAGIDRTARDGRTPSDHTPVTAVLRPAAAD